VNQAKPFRISKKAVWKAYKKVKANGGAAGVDAVSLEEYERDLKNNLYKLWNRMSSGCYFPPPVRLVEIPKKGGGSRPLGIPTVADRIAQMVVKLYLEPELEPYFHEDSYGYRPKKSAIQAVGVARQRCWRYDWVLDLDVKGFFDNLDHELLEKALKVHTDNKWILLYVHRWLKAPVQREDGTLVDRSKGTPQGGVASPLLANLFLHYAFDAWMKRKHPRVPFERYADDIIVHCRSEEEAKRIQAAIGERLRECGLELHPEKTRIVYCKDEDRPGSYPNEKFDFLGYTFRPRRARSKKGRCFVSFLPGVSNTARKEMHRRIRSWRLHRRSDKSLGDLARMYNPVLRGWINYYGVYYTSEMYQT
jgi:RNA-directed DNA polymerase